MTVTAAQPIRRPRVAVTLGDGAGIGPELAAKLVSDPNNAEKADIYMLADRSEVESARSDAHGVSISVLDTAGPAGVQVLEDGTAATARIPSSGVSREGGERCMHQLKRGLDLWRAGEIDAMVFAPLNKSSLKKAGMTEEDELRWFANQLDFKGTTSEINIASLWTARVTSHVGIEKVADLITEESTLKAIELLDRLRWESGIEHPRLGVAALNPHNGENGAFGRQEIEAIAPAVKAAQAKGINVQGPFPCDTIFLKREHFDGIVTMYHDQGQIAMKLLNFDGGVTVQGGLPLPISTPAHGTAFDIVGKNLASVTSMQNAFDVAVTMARRKLEKEAQSTDAPYAEIRAADEVAPHVTTVEVTSCC